MCSITSISSSARSCRATSPIPYEMDFNTCYASVMATTKHVGSSLGRPEAPRGIARDAAHDRRRRAPMARTAVREPVELFRRAADEVRLRRLPLPRTRGCGRHARAAAVGRPSRRDRAGGARRCARARGRRGARRLVYVNAIKPGHPAIFGTWCFVSDLRTGAMSGGSPEQALLSAAAGQMAHFYDLTGGTASGMTDSKLADGRPALRRRSITRSSAMPAPT
jgi:trimethylamine---corrinoid protein Co-methyltransferase